MFHRARLPFFLILAVAATSANPLFAQDAPTNEPPVPADDLKITRAMFGAGGSWRDVTPILQGRVSGGTLVMNVRQPFPDFGGDPAFGFVKNLLVEYRAGGKLYRLEMKEAFPVAFVIRLPSPSAAPAETAPSIPTIVAAAKAAAPRGTSPSGNHPIMSVIALFVSLVALGCSIVALVQLQKMRKG